MAGGEISMKPARRTNPYVYGLGMLGLTIPGQMYTAYAAYYYNTYLGLAMAAIGFGKIFFTIWDAINDPVAGFLSDRTRTKMGRRRPWLLAGAPLFALFFILFFAPPLGLENVIPLIVYFTAFLMLTETMGTIMATNYHALFPELFRTNSDRASANAFRQALQLVGMIIGVSLTPMVANAIGYPVTAAILAVLGMGLLIIATLGSHENPEYQVSKTPGFFESFKAVWCNRNFWTVGITNFFYQATSGLLLASILFYIRYSLGLSDGNATFLTAAVFVPAIPFMWFWWAMIRKFGPLRIWRIALAFLGLSLIPMYFIGSLIPAMIAGVFIGIGIAGVTANIDLIYAKIIDEDAAAYGLRREGIYQSTISFLTRVSGLIQALVFFLIAYLFGFKNGDDPGPMPGVAAKYMMAVFPVALMLLAFITSLFVKFKNEGAKK